MMDESRRSLYLRAGIAVAVAGPFCPDESYGHQRAVPRSRAASRTDDLQARMPTIGREDRRPGVADR